MTEVGVSLALRRQRSLIRSNSRGEKGHALLTKKNRRDNSSSRKGVNNDDNYGPHQQYSDIHHHHYIIDQRQSSSHSPRRRRQRRRLSNGGTVGRDSFRSIARKKKKTFSKDKQSTSYSSWHIFIEGAALYIFCMYLPACTRFLVHWNISCWKPGGIFYQFTANICSTSWFSRFRHCHYFLPSDYIANHPRHQKSVLAPDAGISDVAIVVFLSLTMAIVRVTLVHFLVPNYKQPKRLEALVRCKSIHLLSSQYPGSVTPRSHKNGMNVKTLEHAVNGKLFLPPGLHIPDIHNDGGNNEKYDDDDDEDSLPAEEHTSENIGAAGNQRIILTHNVSPLYQPPSEPHLTPSQGGANREWLSLNDDDDNNGSNNWGLGYDEASVEEEEEDDNHLPAPAVSSGLLTSSSAQNLQALLEQVAPHASLRRNTLLTRKDSSRSIKEVEDRVFAAPKYATAVFRLMFCIFSCLVGLFYFGGADFWPPALGGHGSTKNCWDLGSVGATVMDSDFDQRNTVLRRYYLIQASYHFHSAVFHVLTSLLLWFVSKSYKNKDSDSPAPVFLGCIPAGMFTLNNLRSFCQHCFAIAVILVTYLFSSTRRLGAIAMFAFDASSLFLHLLQLGINAPKQTRHTMARRIIPSSPTSIRILHRLVVIPAFCYARFYVSPFVVGYSALDESQDWLRQLENMLVPGTAQYIHGFFVVAFLLFLFMNFIYFWRLLNHPHVMEALV